ncbi:MAG: hypothetical protein EHM45_00320 [Desulfobacteraceae bacterium]|nr:MAG: hypothetical protein EHM45_00320 [Desulfobacteraceae bacterium]
MILLPIGQKIQENLNTYYLNIEKLIEHYQGELGTGSVYFQSVRAEGAIYFDKDEILNAILESKEEKIDGLNAVNHLIKLASEQNFAVKIYQLDPEHIYFWANLANAKDIYKGLSTEFTDLEGLIKKMSSENLTGYIDVLISKSNESGFVFFNSGQIIGGSYSWKKGELDDSATGWKKLVEKTKSSGGTFNVRSINIPNKIQKMEKVELKKAKPAAVTVAEPRPKTPEPNPAATVALSMQLEGLLDIFERTIKSNKKIKKDFDTVLKKKFLEKVEKYPFLDPFSGDFKYSNKKITFNAKIPEQSLSGAIYESIMELAKELEISDHFLSTIKPWSQKYSIELSNYA